MAIHCNREDTEPWTILYIDYILQLLKKIGQQKIAEAAMYKSLHRY